MKDIAIGFGAGILLILALYFFYHLPEVNSSYKKGYDEGFKIATLLTDTVYIPGEPLPPIIVRDTVEVERPTTVTEGDSSIHLFSSFDSTFVSNKDSIELYVAVRMDIKKDSVGLNLQDIITHWFMRYTHFDHQQSPDTVKVLYPYYVEKEVPFLESSTFAYILGAIALFVSLIL